MKPIKTRKQLEKRINQLRESYEKQIHYKMVEAVNEYVRNNGEQNHQKQYRNSLIRFVFPVHGLMIEYKTKYAHLTPKITGVV